jgi:hypothetical protein
VSSSERQVRVHRLIAHLRSNLVGWIALFVALGGTGYAAISIPRNSVGAAQIRNRSITPVKFNPKSIGGSVRAWAIVRADGSVIASAGKPTVSVTPAVPGSYGMQWGVTLPRTCATIANIDARSPAPTETVVPPGGGGENIVAGYVSQVNTVTLAKNGKRRRVAVTSLVTLNQTGQPTALGFDVAVIC